jgi:hypothetical protein
MPKQKTVTPHGVKTGSGGLILGIRAILDLLKCKPTQNEDSKNIQMRSVD